MTDEPKPSPDPVREWRTSNPNDESSAPAHRERRNQARALAEWRDGDPADVSEDD